ncbi:hypothetical protein OJF2_79210 (plasmid) [Aquisphaera giovannonii]|uniref:Uncharacterized protein n=1 Tax=Aquisphaera giovannonii TaxID=406548 RepID=A0A5B9WF95_9BACT|nr:hypothetical protein [Aquisphaera giovannonii]QEH39306.1 hypothetical protein OJF2_79210 [Aquisphaera giovannonii]
MAIPAGILQPTTLPEEPPADEGQGGAARDEAQDAKAVPRAARKSKIATKAGSGRVEGRKLYLPEDLYFRLRMLAYQRGQKLSECAAEVLDKALPKWTVSRDG